MKSHNKNNNCNSVIKDCKATASQNHMPTATNLPTNDLNIQIHDKRKQHYNIVLQPRHYPIEITPTSPHYDHTCAN